MREPRILLVDNYDSYTWNLWHLLWSVSGTRPVVVRNDETDVDSLLRQDFSHIVISPGPGTPDDPDDVGLCAELVARVRVPCLGVCLGHQGLAAAFGATVARAPEIVHGGVSPITHTGEGLFAGLPQKFGAVRYHSLAVTGEIPAELAVTAWTDSGVVMGLSHRDRPLVGVQFHPESVATEFGAELIANFLRLAPKRAAGVRAAATAPTDQQPPAERPARPARAADRAGQVRWAELTADVTAESLFAHAFSGEPHAFWLDSARTAYGMGRYSYLGSATGACTRIVRAFAATGEVEVQTATVLRRRRESLFDHLRGALAETRVDPATCPVPFTGGYLGYLGYGLKGSVGVGRPGRGPRPDAELLRVDRFVAFDHETGRRYLVTVDMSPAEHGAWCATMRRAAEQAAASPAASSPADLRAETPAGATMTAAVGRAAYGAHVEQVQTWLRDGNTYEACYTYQLAGTTAADPFATYRRLRADNPAPYAAYLRLGERSVLSSSPERFLTVDPHGRAETKPIKGTAARAGDPQRDAHAAQELRTDSKLRSENMMITDLLRNDLGRVCDRDSVHVPALMAVESYATVHQLVTTVRGTLRPDVTAVDCAEALFPAGSMTGAPKLRTVRLLDDLEPEDRGIYAGSLGYFGFDGSADFSVVIRTIVWEGNQVRIGVGGAIIVLSDTDAEYAETRLKGRALLRVLGVEDDGDALRPVSHGAAEPAHSR